MAQLAEATDLKSVCCRFESDWGYVSLRVRAMLSHLPPPNHVGDPLRRTPPFKKEKVTPVSNPVMNRLSADIQQTTPAGYPTMPGYQPGTYNQGYATPQSAGASNYAPPASIPMEDLERSYHAPSADAIDRGQMTYDDVIVKTGAMLGLLVVAASVAWYAAHLNPVYGVGAMASGFLGAFVLAMVNSFSRTVRPALVIAYAALEGVGLGAFSAVMDARYPGVVIQALVGTVAVFAVTLALFSSGKVRNSSKMMKFTLIGIIGIIVFRLLSFVLSLFGVIDTSLSNITIMGIPLGVGIGLLAVVLGAMSLIGDFDMVKKGVERGAPASFAWYATFGLLVTIVWMYMEILRLLSYFRD